ncbi:dUTP diphosphatase [Pseudohongiella acticola]|jgi:dimeric dUTPase (all-alpha-NTP-PPase superfamily)|uniref:dUTP diphosphatase n=1 Tax=Pseudohongiella acticola TaxID=1524254 RepID=UPI0030EB8BF5
MTDSSPLMPTQQQLNTMLSLQSAMNRKVDPDWIAAAYPYLRAVVVEAAEAIEHHGWKWWKKQELDLAQLQMEVIDIWHFILSEVLLREKGDETAACVKLLADCGDSSGGAIDFDNRPYSLAAMTLLDKLELLTALAAARRIEISVFASIMKDCDMSWDELFAQYVSKNVLNFFRQDHGYKDGSYQKVWHGKEDNEHLVEVMATLSATSETYPTELYQALKQRYPA